MIKLVVLLTIIGPLILEIRSDNINIAGIFEGNEIAEKAFSFAIEIANEERSPESQLVAISDNETPELNPFLAMNSTCNLLTNGIAAVFGPKSTSNIDSVQSVCDDNEIPHILIRWNYRPSRVGTIVNFYPHPPVLSKAYFDIITAWDWKTFTVLYEDNESLLRVSDLIIAAKDAGMVVTVEQLDKYGTENYRPILKKVWRTEQKFFVIDCQIERLKKVLLQCQQIGMMTFEYNYFITNMDTHTLDLLEFQFSEVNITGIRLINPDSEHVQRVSEGLLSENENGMGGMLLAWKLKTETALLTDAVGMFARTLSNLEYSEHITTQQLSCGSSDHWSHGLSVTNIIKSSVYNGLTGTIKFDNEGFRSDFDLEVFEIREGGITKVGNWNQKGINITRVQETDSLDDPTSMRNKTYIVITTLTDPYGMLKESSKALVGNDRFEGFGIDLIYELSLMEGFNYTFIIREDKKNGKKEDSGEWSGMIGDVMYHRADLAITDLTITSDREEAVDFTSPFMNLGISILFSKPSKAPPNFFSFAEPFALNTWIALGVAFLVVSFSFFILGRMCPDEWTNPYPCIEEPEFLVNQFSLGNSFWFSTGAIMCQGSEIAPIAPATRLLSGIWWFFVLLLVASYTANLASFLVTENKIELITDVNSLVERAETLKIKYGAKLGGATATFFENQRSNPIFAKIDDYMKKHPEDMVDENKKGVERAEKEKYAFFMESTSISYETQRRCELMMVGGLLDNKGYGIAMRKDSPYRTRLSTAILKLQSSGVIEEIKRKWWEERRGGGQCEGESSDQEATPLDLKNVEGVFYVTIFGTVTAALLVLIEYMINILNTSRHAKMSFKEVLKEEVKHYIDFSSNTKPVIRRSSESKSGSDVEKSEESEKSKSPPNQLNGRLENGPNRRSQSQRTFPIGFTVGPMDESLTGSA